MSSSPSRFTAGFTQDASYQPLGNIGVPDPFFYAYYEDDFLPYNSALYTPTLDGGSAAQTAGTANVGGRVTLTTEAAASGYVSLQTTTAGIQWTSTHKLFYACRIQLAAIAGTGFIVGLIETVTTPFSAITDGIYISYTAGGTTMTLTAVTGSTTVGTASIPVAPVNATDIDLAFVVDRLGNIAVYAGNSLFGNKTYQYENLAEYGAVAKLYNQNATAGTNIMTGAITSALLNPTIAVSTTAAAETLIADFQAAGFER